MLRLLIVDDEKIIRETIHNLIDWESLGITVVGVCKNGIEAYDAILDESPNIVLTDIKMPGLSGLELIKRVCQLNLNIEFIILSGYGEFELAKEAMQYGVRHYLLKPCSEEQIVSVIEECKKAWFQKMNVSALREQQQVLNRNLQQTMIQNMIVESLLAGEGENLGARADQYELMVDMERTPYELCYLYYVEDQNKEEALSRIRAHIQEKEYAFAPTFLYVPYTMVLFFKSMVQCYDEFDSFVRSICFKNQTVSLEYKRETCGSLRELLKVVLAGVGRFETIYLANSMHKLVPLNNYHSFTRRAEQLVEKMASAVQEEREEARKELFLLFSSITDVNFLKTLVIHSVVKYNEQASKHLNQVFFAEFLMEINRYQECGQVIEKTREVVEGLINPKKREAAGYKDFIEKTKQYVEDNLSNPNLSLKWIAENYLYMNVDYVSKQFIKETGDKFSSYLTNVRVNRAKELLMENGSESIINIAEAVGCGNNPQYFSQIFKRQTGLTPTAYIKMMKGES